MRRRYLFGGLRRHCALSKVIYLFTHLLTYRQSYTNICLTLIDTAETRAQLSLGLADRTHGAHSQPASTTVRVYITSGSYVNKLNVRYLLEILELQIAAKQLQLATWLYY